jgi:DNA primase
MNFEKMFRDYHVDYSTRVNRGWTNCTCPHCDDKTFNGGFNNIDGHYHCWKCGGHDMKKTLQLVLGIPSNEIKSVLSEYEGRNGVLQELNKKTAKAKHLELPSDSFTPAERKYLLSRNFSPRFLHEKYGVVGGGIAGDWKYRIIIPLYYNGVLVSWTGRSILDKQTLKEKKIPRYKNLAIEKSIYSSKDLFYNMDKSQGKSVILTEGCFDVIRLGDKDGNSDNVICSLGTQLTEAQVKLLSQNYEKIFIMFDNEPEAQEKARKFGMKIASMGIEVEIVNFYEDFGVNDGGELSDNEVKIIRKELGL